MESSSNPAIDRKTSAVTSAVPRLQDDRLFRLSCFAPFALRSFGTSKEPVVKQKCFESF